MQVPLMHIPQARDCFRSFFIVQEVAQFSILRHGYKLL